MRLAEFNGRKYPPQEKISVDLDRVLMVRYVGHGETQLIFEDGERVIVFNEYENVKRMWEGAS